MRGVASTVRRMAARTPASRDRSVDLMRGLAICQVVLVGVADVLRVGCRRAATRAGAAASDLSHGGALGRVHLVDQVAVAVDHD
jgi:hypothetical protein